MAVNEAIWCAECGGHCLRCGVDECYCTMLDRQRADREEMQRSSLSDVLYAASLRRLHRLPWPPAWVGWAQKNAQAREVKPGVFVSTSPSTSVFQQERR